MIRIRLSLRTLPYFRLSLFCFHLSLLLPAFVRISDILIKQFKDSSNTSINKSIFYQQFLAWHDACFSDSVISFFQS